MYKYKYESGLEPLREYCNFSQSSMVIVCLELFEWQRSIERLSQQFFEMYKNIITMTSNHTVKYLVTKCPKKQFVSEDYFIMEKNQFLEK